MSNNWQNDAFRDTDNPIPNKREGQKEALGTALEQIKAQGIALATMSDDDDAILIYNASPKASKQAYELAQAVQQADFPELKPVELVEEGNVYVIRFKD